MASLPTTETKVAPGPTTTKAESELQNPLDVSPDSLFCFGPGDKIEAVNDDTLRRIFRRAETLTKKELIGAGVGDLDRFSEEQRRELERAFAEVREGKNPKAFIGEADYRGTGRVLEFSFIPLGREGKLQIILTVKDATAEIEKSIKETAGLKALISAKQAEARQEVNAAVQDGINNPLTGVIGNVEWLLKYGGEKLPPEMKAALEDIEKSGRRIKDAVSALNRALKKEPPPKRQYNDGSGRIMIDIQKNS